MNYYTVERVCDDRMRGGVRYFLVKWAGYSESENTWEPEENLRNCRHFIDDYLERKKSKSKKHKQTHTRMKSNQQQIVTQLQYRDDVGRPIPSVPRIDRVQSDSDTDSWESDNEIEDILGVKLVDGEILFDVQKHASRVRQMTKAELQRYHTKIYLKFLEELLSKS